MRTWLMAVLTLIAPSLLCCFGFAQRRDSAAIAILNQSIGMMGASSLLNQFGSVQVSASLQGSSGTNTPSGALTWEFQFDSSGCQFRDEFKTDSTDQVVVSGNGSPVVSNNGSIRQLPPYIGLAMLPMQLPAVVLNMVLANSSYTVTLQPALTVNGVLANQVRISLDTDSTSSLVTPQDWYFDSATGLPLRVEFREPSSQDPTQYTQASADFSNYQQVQGVLIPFIISNTEDGMQTSATTISSVVWNYQTSPSDFTF